MGNQDLLEERPTVPQTFHQLGVLVLDGSGSMDDLTDGRIRKAEVVQLATKELLGRLRVSKNSKDFSIAVVTFDTSAKIHSPITRVDDGEGNLIDEYADYNPMKGHGGGTDIGAGLRVAESLAEEFLNSAPMESVPHSVAIVVMSDGMSGGNPIPIANRLKDNRRITICTALLAKKGENSQDDKKARELLQEIASSPIAYTTVYDAESLRRFFVASVSVGCDVHMR